MPSTTETARRYFAALAAHDLDAAAACWAPGAIDRFVGGPELVGPAGVREYTLDPQTGIKGAARVPHPAFNFDTEQARDSIRKLGALEPSAAWAGHAEPVTGDVRSQLEHVAATPS